MLTCLSGIRCALRAYGLSVSLGKVLTDKGGHPEGELAQKEIRKTLPDLELIVGTLGPRTLCDEF